MSQVTDLNISMKDFNRFYVKYYGEPEFKHQRIGQAFCNEYNLTNSVLFYETTAETAVNYIIENYVKGCSYCGACNQNEYDLYCNSKCMENDND